MENDLKNLELNVLELRTQLEQVNEKIDLLQGVIEREQTEIDTLKQDLKTYQDELDAATVAKCKANASLEQMYCKLLAAEEQNFQLLIEDSNLLLQLHGFLYLKK